MSINSILILRTNIQDSEGKGRVAALLNPHPGIKRWSIDLEDTDKVLRIVTDCLSLDDIIQLLTQSGFQAEDLD